MLVPAAVFVATALAIFLAGWLLTGIGRNRTSEVFSGSRRRPLIFGPLTVALAGVLPASKNSRDKISRDLVRAGYYHRQAYEEFAALRNALAVGCVFLAGTLIVAIPESDPALALKILLAGVVGALMCYSLPRLALHSQASGRLNRIQYGLPDALDMITMCMTGGLPLHLALRRVSDEMGTTHADLACELKIVERQTNAGSFQGALERFAARMDTPDVQSLATIVGHADARGADVGGALEEFADGVRLEQRQRAEERGNKASVKMLLPLVFCLAPPVYILLLAPAVMELRDFVLKENRPGGVLAPTSLSAPLNTPGSAPTDVDNNAVTRPDSLRL